MKRKKIPTKIMIGILFCLLLTSDVQSIRLTIPKPSKISKIAEQIQSISSESDRCGTTTIFESLKKNQKILSFGVQDQSTSSIRPTDPGGGIDGNQHILPKLYNTTHFVIHWTNGTDGGSSTDAPLPNTDDNKNQIPDVIENWGEIFEYVWNFEINARGFHAPPADENESNDANNRNPDGRYDVFIYNMKYYGYSYPEQWPDSPSYSYIAVENDYIGFHTQGVAAMQVTAAHEFFHAIQFYYDCTEEIWWMETTATYMEDEVYPDVNDNYQYLPSWFLYCDTYGLESTEGLHEYGNFIFAKRLSEDFGDNIIREIWEEMTYTNGLVAIENTLVSKNSTLASEFSKFTTANFFLEDMYVDGADYRSAITGIPFNGVWLEYQYDASTAPNVFEINSSNVNWDAWMDKWATDYITIKLDPTKPKYRISFDGLDLTTSYLIKLVTKKSEVLNETIFSLNAQKDGYLDLLYDTFDNATLIIANAGNTRTANPSWRVIITILSESPKPPQFYDVAIINVEPSTYFAFSGETINIGVTVKNNGTIRNESFNVSTYWGNFLIETKPVTNLLPDEEKTLNIAWTIPPELNGSERILANTTIVSDETNLENNRFEDGMLQIAVGTCDVAVESIILSKNIVGQKQTMNITITVGNQGSYTETFNVTTCVNTTVIQTQTVTLMGRSSVTLTLSWNTSNFSKGNYTLSVEVSIVPNETDIIDNSLTGGWIIISVIGDITGPLGWPDGVCDIRDIYGICMRYMKTEEYDSNWDVNNDGLIDIKDIYEAVLNYMKSDP